MHLSRPPYRHFERSREIFLALRFSDICILRFTACHRDPSTSLGMTIHAKHYQKLRRSRHLPRRTQRTCLNLLNPFPNYIVKIIFHTPIKNCGEAATILLFFSYIYSSLPAICSIHLNIIFPDKKCIDIRCFLIILIIQNSLANLCRLLSNIDRRLRSGPGDH